VLVDTQAAELADSWKKYAA